MKKRIIKVLLFLGMFPMIALIPVWTMLYILNGSFYVADYLDYMNDKLLE